MRKRIIGLLVFLSVLLLCAAALADWQIENDTYLTYVQNGKKITGNYKIGTATYQFTNEGHLVYSGKPIVINGSIYYIQPNHVLATGWQTLPSGKYFFGEDHKALTGWQSIGSHFYYFEPSLTATCPGAATTGARTIDNQLCTFDANGILQGNGRTVTIGGHIYALDSNNACVQGWASIAGATYYFGPHYQDDGTPVNNGYAAATGACYIANSKEHYYFSADGKMRTGLLTMNGKIYYYDPASTSWAINPAAHAGARFYSGWKVIAGNTYFFNEDGAYTGIKQIWDGVNSYNYYYFSAEGILQTGRVVDSGKVYFFDPASTPAGRMITGWYSPTGTQWYYLTTDGAYTGLQTIRDEATGTFSKYYFSSEGFLQYNWITISNRLYYFDPAQNGKLVKGWQLIDGNRYYFDETNDYAVTGLQSLTDPGDGKTYDFYFSADGKLQYGLQTIGGLKYYFDPGTGRRANGWRTIDGDDYYFAPYAMTNTLLKLTRNGLEGYYEFDAEGRAVSSDRTVMSFVERCYNKILNRSSDPVGLVSWVDMLRSGQMDAATLINQFMNSPEFLGRGLANGDKVEILYNTMLDRASDQTGKAGWQAYLDAGCTDKAVINGFSGSAEFNQLCNEYGITSGGVTIEYRDVSKEVTGFVQRCYQMALDRDGEPAGMNDWCHILLVKALSPKEVATRFVMSNEFMTSGLTTEETIERLYQLYLGRASDPAGKTYWVDQVTNHGLTLQQLNDGFADSAEFQGIVKDFGL